GLGGGTEEDPGPRDTTCGETARIQVRTSASVVGSGFKGIVSGRIGSAGDQDIPDGPARDGAKSLNGYGIVWVWGTSCRESSPRPSSCPGRFSLSSSSTVDVDPGGTGF